MAIDKDPIAPPRNGNAGRTSLTYTEIDVIEEVELDPAEEVFLDEKPLNPTAVSGNTNERASGVLTQNDTQQASPSENPALKKFKADYDELPDNLKAKCPWEIAQARLLANDGEKLKLAQAMEQGGILFGVDNNGKLLFADKGDEPIMRGMNHPETRARVLYKHTSLDENGEMNLDKNKQPIPTGYTMFPSEGGYDKDDEVIQYEEYTGKPFVKPTYGNAFRSSWLESEDTRWPHNILFEQSYGCARVSFTYANANDYRRGVRRLLRV